MSIYYIKQKKFSIRDIYYLYIDKDEKPILEIIDNNYLGFLDNVLGSIFSFSRNFVAKDANGKDIFTIHKKMGFIWEKYDIVIDNKVVASISQEKTLVTPKFTILTENSSYIASSNLVAKKFLIKENHILVAEVNKKLLALGDIYEINIYINGQDELIIATTIALDNSFHN